METSKDCKESRTNNRARRPRSEPPSHVRLAEEENQDQETFVARGRFFSRGFLTSLLQTYPSLGVGLRGGEGGRGMPQHAVRPGDIIAFFSEL